MKTEQIKELIQAFDKSSLSFLSIKQDDTELKMKKNAKQVSAEKQTTDHSQSQAIIPQMISEPMTIIPEVKDELLPGEIVRSPIVGTFYSAASPDKPPFVKPGDKVREGDVLCIIEAMKVMNEITSRHNGEIAEVLVENESTVEFSQPLFRILI